eukprot:1158198-Pelagomonas_calceolata.AAC.11
MNCACTARLLHSTGKPAARYTHSHTYTQSKENFYIQPTFGQGANPHLADRLGGRTPLHYACFFGKSTAISALLDNLPARYLRNPSSSGRNSGNQGRCGSLERCAWKAGSGKQFNTRGVENDTLKSPFGLIAHNKERRNCRMLCSKPLLSQLFGMFAVGNNSREDAYSSGGTTPFLLSSSQFSQSCMSSSARSSAVLSRIK